MYHVVQGFKAGTVFDIDTERLRIPPKSFYVKDHLRPDAFLISTVVVFVSGRVSKQREGRLFALLQSPQ